MLQSQQENKAGHHSTTETRNYFSAFARWADAISSLQAGQKRLSTVRKTLQPFARWAGAISSLQVGQKRLSTVGKLKYHGLFISKWVTWKCIHMFISSNSYAHCRWSLKIWVINLSTYAVNYFAWRWAINMWMINMFFLIVILNIDV